MKRQSCGEALGARCDPPGMAFPACPKLCARAVNHPGRCWCTFHQTNPNESWQAMEERLWKGETFQELLELLQRKDLMKHAGLMIQEGIRSPRELEKVDLENLILKEMRAEEAMKLRVKD